MDIIEIGGLIALCIYLVILSGQIKDLRYLLMQQQNKLSALAKQLSDKLEINDSSATNIEQATLVTDTELSSELNSAVSNQEPYVQSINKSNNTLDSLINSFVIWLKDDWLLKLGAFFIILGFTWLISYGFINQWITPAIKISLGIISGLSFIVFGWYRIKNFILQGGIFSSLGATILLIVVYFARNSYNFLSPAIALIFIFMVSGLISFISIKYKSKSLSMLSLVMASITPLIINSVSSDYVSLYSYLLVVTIATLWVVFITAYQELAIASMIIVSLYSIGIVINNTHTNILLTFVNLFGLIYLLASIICIIRLLTSRLYLDATIAIGNGVFLLIYILAVVNSSAICSYWLIVWAVIFAITGFYLARKTGKVQYCSIYNSVAIGLIFSATTVYFYNHYPVLSIILAVEISIVTFILTKINNNARVAELFSRLIVIPSLMALCCIDYAVQVMSVWNEYGTTLLVMAIILFGLGYYLYQVNQFIKSVTSYVYLISGTFYVYVWIWLAAHSIGLNNNIAVTIALIIYTVIGIFSYFIGVKKLSKVLQYYGVSLIGFVALRLLLVDAWQVELYGKIITFFVIGVVLIITAFYTRRNK
jgi:uncharacterized membrane protein